MFIWKGGSFNELIKALTWLNVFDSFHDKSGVPAVEKGQMKTIKSNGGGGGTIKHHMGGANSSWQFQAHLVLKSCFRKEYTTIEMAKFGEKWEVTSAWFSKGIDSAALGLKSEPQVTKICHKKIQMKNLQINLINSFISHWNYKIDVGANSPCFMVQKERMNETWKGLWKIEDK